MSIYEIAAVALGLIALGWYIRREYKKEADDD